MIRMYLTSTIYIQRDYETTQNLRCAKEGTMDGTIQKRVISQSLPHEGLDHPLY
jgi:hypothetical protein